MSSQHTVKGKEGVWKGTTKERSKSDDSFDRTLSAGADSQEFIIQGNRSGDGMEKGVMVKTTVQIDSEDVGEGDAGQNWKYSTGETQHKVSVQAKHYGTGL